MQMVNDFGKYVRAARLFSLPCSVFPAAVGYIFTEKSSDSLLLLLIFSIVVLLLHVASNLLNTYYDYQYKVRHF